MEKKKEKTQLKSTYMKADMNSVLNWPVCTYKWIWYDNREKKFQQGLTTNMEL